MGFPEELRRNAADCVRRAQEAATLENRTAWLSMAQFSLQLAQHTEEQDAQRACAAPTVFDNRQARPDLSESTDRFVPAGRDGAWLAAI